MIASLLQLDISPELIGTILKDGGVSGLAMFLVAKLLWNGSSQKIRDIHSGIAKIDGEVGEVRERVHGIDSRLIRVETRVEERNNRSESGRRTGSANERFGDRDEAGGS